MTGPHWKYLTNGYVEARGMQPFMAERRHPVAVWVGENATKPVAYRAFDRCVVTTTHSTCRSLTASHGA